MPELKRPFWGWLLSEADGTPSTSRFLAVVMTFFVLGWDTAHMALTKQLVPVADLLGQIGFCTAFYNFNAIKTWAIDKNNNTPKQD
jgi:hypothetical protein